MSNHVTFIQIRPAQFFFSKTIIVFDARRPQLWQGWTNRAKSRLQININTSLYIYIEWRLPGWLCVTLQTDWITQYSSLDPAPVCLSLSVSVSCSFNCRICIKITWSDILLSHISWVLPDILWSLSLLILLSGLHLFFLLWAWCPPCWLKSVIYFAQWNVIWRISKSYCNKKEELVSDY